MTSMFLAFHNTACRRLVRSLMLGGCCLPLAGCDANAATDDDAVADDDAAAEDDAAADDDAATDDESIAFRLGTTTVPVGANQFAYKYFDKKAGYRYTRCLDTKYGDPDLYGHHDQKPTKSNWQFKSANDSSGSDCISFDATSNGIYYMGIYGFNEPSEALYRQTTYQNDYVPSHMYKKLVWPVNNCKSLTQPTDAGGAVADPDNVVSFGGFGSPWGNYVSNPFYSNQCNGGNSCKNFLHTGADIACTKGTTVRAACTGPVVKEDSAGTGWGHSVVQECTGADQKKYSVAYLHITDYGHEVGDTLTAGSTIVGKIADLNVSGEEDHLHLAVCNGSYSTCTSTKCAAISNRDSRPQGGALPDECFPGLLINAHIGTNPSLYK